MVLPFSSLSMLAGLLLTRLADLPTAGILEDITLGGAYDQNDSREVGNIDDFTNQ